MGFAEDIKALGEKANSVAPHGLDERNTESVLIEPFIQALGYDTGNTSEVRRQLPAAYSGRGKKVDYAILEDSKPAILFECKRVGGINSEKSERAAAEQLSRYFNNTPTAKFGILTDGVEYRFFTDLVLGNVMDKKPFHVFSLRELDEPAKMVLQRFTRPNFNAEEIRASIRQASEIRDILNNELKDPIGLVRFFADRVFPKGTVKSKNLRNRFKPVVRQVLAEFFNVAPQPSGIVIGKRVRIRQTARNKAWRGQIAIVHNYRPPGGVQVVYNGKRMWMNAKNVEPVAE